MTNTTKHPARSDRNRAGAGRYPQPATELPPCDSVPANRKWRVSRYGPGCWIAWQDGERLPDVLAQTWREAMDYALTGPPAQHGPNPRKAGVWLPARESLT